MNAEQLHAVCGELKQEIESTRLLQKLQELETSLSNSVGNPAQPQFQEEIQNHRTEISELLQKVEAENRPTNKRLIIAEIGAERLVGKGLLDRINESFAQIDLTPSVVHSDIAKIRQELVELLEGLNHLIEGFERFSIEMDELDPYEAELGILVPRNNDGVHLLGLVVDLKNLNQELGVFQELVTGKADNFEVRSISSSEFQFFLDLLPDTAATIAATVVALGLAYDKLLDIRIKRKELEEQEAPESVVEPLDQWAESIMGDSIKKLAADLVEQYSDVERPDGREHEIETAVRFTLKKMSGRLDVGYHFSVRVGPEPDVNEEDEDYEEEEHQRQVEVVRSIQQDGSKIEHRELPGEPVLPLEWRPDGEEEQEEQEDE